MNRSTQPNIANAGPVYGSQRHLFNQINPDADLNVTGESNDRTYPSLAACPGGEENLDRKD